MANTNLGDSVPNPDASGEQETKPETKESVSRETYLRVLDEAKKAKEKARELDSRLAEIERSRKLAEEAKLHEQGEYKKILEQREKELSEINERYTGLQTSLQDSIKFQAVTKLLGGELKNPAYKQFIDIGSIAFANHESYELDYGTVQAAANKFLQEHSHLIKKEKANIPNGNSPAPNGGGNLTYEQWLALPLKEQKARIKDVKK